MPILVLLKEYIIKECNYEPIVTKETIEPKLPFDDIGSKVVKVVFDAMGSKIVKAAYDDTQTKI